MRALALAAALIAPPALACEAPDGLLFHACDARVEILLLPEEDAAPGGVLVTGAYTAKDRRDGDLPKPVGVFIAKGKRISLELGRMDGLLTVDAKGDARISTITDAHIGAGRFDLSTLQGRVGFARQAEVANASALQSHLLIRDGALDVRPVEGAPVFRRRILFQMPDGAVGVWDSGLEAKTLHDAGAMVLAAFSPAMALNLDMGSYDFCESGDPPQTCGILSREGMDRLSNLIRLSTR